MKLEVGMYLRYEGLDGDCPIIQKIIELKKPGRCGGKYKVFTDKTNDWFIDSDYIEMAIENSEIPLPSFNIIDLIEKGDYVNKHLVTEIFLSGESKYIKLDNSYANGEGIRIYEENIKTVVTHEQFKNWEYEVGE